MRKTKHAEGGIAGMLGEPRSGYNEGGYVGYWKMVQDKYYEVKEIDPDKFGKMSIQDFAKKYFPRPGQAEGGRIGLAEGDTPSQAWMRDYFYDAGYDDLGVITLDDYINGGQGWRDYMNHGPGKAKGGRIGAGDGYKPGDFEKFNKMKEDIPVKNPFEGVDLKLYKELLEQGIDANTAFKRAGGKAEGGRIGFKEGEGIMSRTGDMVDMRNVPYYAGEGLKGLVNSVETLSKFPLAAGKLGSQLLQQPPKKEMFTEAIENITPGSWSENLGLTSLVEGMAEKRPKDAQTVGGILGLGTEIAVPTGGAFKAGQLLLSKASKAMGKVKDGKTLEKLVDQKLTNAGQSRRDFNIMAATSGLVGALKWLGLGGLLKTTAKLKPSDDVVIRLKTFIDDSDVQTEWGPQATAKFGGFFDIESLTKAAAKTLKKISDRVDNKGFGWSTHRTGHNKGIYEYVPLEDGSYIADILKKAGHKVKLEHVDDVGGMGVDEILWKFKNDPMYKGTKEGAENYKKFSKKVKKMTERERFEYHNSITDDYGSHYSTDVEDLLDVLMPVKKAEGGRIGLDTGGLAGMLGERTGFPKGKRVRKQPKKPKTMTMEEAIEDINKKLKDPDITDDESRRLRIILHDLILGPGMGGPRGDKIYQGKEDLPEGILELLQKDPAFDFEEFSEIEWSPEGMRWTDKGHPGKGNRGMAGPMGIWSGMAPFGETAYMDEGRGPRNRNIHLKDLDKAKIINHELRHNLMGEEGSPLYHTQPEWVKEYKGPSYLRSEDDKPIGTSGHELYNRFIDSRLFPGEEHSGSNEPYFDKILRDYWEPNFQEYKKAVKELKSKPEHLSSEGGRMGLQTGGPPITLQRPLFNQGGLTKTIPPERGPNPQGLPSALYNGIMRPRSY